jgi:hypothetical protein
MILSLPFLAVLVAFDLMKAPVLIFFILPIGGLIDSIAVLRGDDPMLLSAIPGIFFMGVAMWLEIVGLPEPQWMDWI